MSDKPRPIHNTNSPNFIKLDFTDLTYIKNWAEELGGLSDDEDITLARVKKMIEFMIDKKGKI